MSFYGDITNTTRTPFQFDRIYPNRVEMEANKTQDGIYAGRFVLIEYDSTHLDSFLRVYKKDNSFYSNKDCTIETLLTKNNITNGTVVYTSTLETIPINGYFAKDCVFYRCTSTNVEDGNEPAEFEQIEDTTQLNYLYNYQIDKEIYNRGYDSTVWQKVYSSGQEKYIMIAELNTTVPVLDITTDAPTQSPVAPHFDIDSSNIYYKLHTQPSWGMRVKSATLPVGPVFNNNGQPNEENFTYYTTEQSDERIRSDETTVWKREEYNPETGEITILYWHPATNSWETEPPVGEENQVKAAIYYNEAGFDPETISIDDIENHITIEPTGISGHLYNQHNGEIDEKQPEPDIQEISVMLPAIGNSVARMWNIVYGDQEINGNTRMRNTDISWNSTDGLRMVEQTDNGLSYSTNKVETLAGAINSVHDLMGMIIEDVSSEENSFDDIDYNKTFAATADANKIYYNNGKYYRRALGYNYTAAYSNVENGEYENLPSIIEPKDLDYVRVNEFENFPAGEYYYTNNNHTIYIKETNNYPTLGRYYCANKNDETIPLFNEVGILSVYIKGQFYRLDGFNYVTDDEPVNGKEYYTLNINTTTGQPYVKNQFYIYDDGKEMGDNPTLNDVAKLKLSTGDFQEGCFYYTVNISNGVITIHEITLFELNSSIYYKDGDNYLACVNGVAPDNVDTYYTLSTNEGPFTDFFSDNTYYTYENGIYTLAQNCNEETPYYKKEEENEIQIVANKPENSRFYISNTYYYFDAASQQYILDTALAPTAGRSYFVRGITLYVLIDENEVYGTGAIWNSKITSVPSGIVLAKRSEYMEMKELVGFARELSTIHGLILKMNNLLLVGDIHTRDPETVQGTINRLQDIIARFEIINPGNIMITDDYGRVHGALYEGDNWININVDSNVNAPKIEIIHEYTPETPPALTAVNPNVDTDINSIILETVKIDDTGHVVYKANSEVILPVAFKQITINDNVDNVIEANSCRDGFNINGDNVISINVDSENSSINLVHNEIEETSTENIINITEESNELQVENIYANDYGHVNRREIVKYNFSNIYDNISDINGDLTQIQTDLRNINTSLTEMSFEDYKDTLQHILNNLKIINTQLNINYQLPQMNIPILLIPNEESEYYLYNNGTTPLSWRGYNYNYSDSQYSDLIDDSVAEDNGNVLYLQNNNRDNTSSTILKSSSFKINSDNVYGINMFFEFDNLDLDITTLAALNSTIYLYDSDSNEIIASEAISSQFIYMSLTGGLPNNMYIEIDVANSVNKTINIEIRNMWITLRQQ